MSIFKNNICFIILMINKTTIPGLAAITLTAMLVVSMIMTPALASGGYLAIDDTHVKAKKKHLDIKIKTEGKIPLDGSAGAFGYAVLTGGFNNVLVLVTHLGLDDSTHEDPVSGFHTHVLDLMAPSTSCDTYDAEVDLVNSGLNSAFDADYDWKIHGEDASIKHVPISELGGSDVQGIVSFTVTPVDDAGLHLCVDVQ